MQRTRVLQHHYNALTQKWTKSQSEIQIEDQPFAEGAFRAAYASVMAWEGNPSCQFVCKFAKDPSTHKSMYFNDVEAHEIATLYARHFNDRLPEKYPRIGYVPAFIVEFVDRPGRPVCGCEQNLDGKFKKYNNNVGAVCALTAEEQADLQRCSLVNWDPTGTAQAFSHFSWEHSQGQVLCCDIQGVENRFTDPQIHTMSGKGFGLGNLGQTGIRAFLLRHTCTDMCRAIGLQPIKAKDLNEKQIQANFSSTPVHHAPPGSNIASSGSGSATPKRASGPVSDVLIIGGNDAPPPQHRGMSSSASTAIISQQAAQAAISSSNGRPPHAPISSSQQQQQQHLRPSASSFTASSAPHSSRNSTTTTPVESPRGSPQAQSRCVVAAQQPPPPPPKPVGLDIDDEALMASIMGD